MIVILDYGMGNIGSVLNMLRKIKAPAKISTRAEDILAADKLILPGVGAFDTGMRHLQNSGTFEAINQKVLSEKIPTLGICLGMQLMMHSSDEGNMPGLGWIEGKTVRFRFKGDVNKLKVPHMGWNTASIRDYASIFKGLEGREARFYFVHSYHVVCDQEENVLATTQHGYEFASAIRLGNIVGTQFHPEKSHKFGMRLLKNFAEWS